MNIEELQLILKTFETVSGYGVMGASIYFLVQALSPLAKISIICYTIVSVIKLLCNRFKVEIKK